MTATISAPPPVLYAEDDEDDAFFMQRALVTVEILNPLQVAGTRANNGGGHFEERVHSLGLI